MRNTFINELFEIAKNKSEVMIVTGDLGYGVLDAFKNQLPKQFINAGVAEQGMTGFAAGAALAGKTVFTYSIANFPTIRCLEQIRNDVCYHKANVKIVSVGAGVSYGTHGYTHFGVEDLAIMRTLPYLEILSPCDPYEAKAAAQYAANTPGPMYVRLGKNGEPNIHKQDISLGSKLNYELFEGDEIYILATGSIVLEAYKAIEEYNRTSIKKVGLISCPWVKPFDCSLLKRLQEKKVQKLITLEEHGPSGGFYSVILEEMMNMQMHFQVTRLSLPEMVGIISPQSEILKYYQIDSKSIYNLIDKIKN